MVRGSTCRLPSFFVIGPPRTGTSWLQEVFKPHVILPYRLKETRFFDSHFFRGIEWYCAHFRPAEGQKPMGEIAPTYFASPSAQQRIAQIIPSAKVICIFRNPIERLLSLYKMKRAYGWIPWTLEEAVVRDPELLETGKYSTHLRAWQKALGEHQILPVLYEDLQQFPQAFVDTLADFISIPRFTLSNAQLSKIFASSTMTEPRNYNRTRGATLMADWCKSRGLGAVASAVRDSPLLKLFVGGGAAFPEVKPEVLLNVYQTLGPEVEELELILGRELTAWKLPTTSSPSLEQQYST